MRPTHGSAGTLRLSTRAGAGTWKRRIASLEYRTTWRTRPCSSCRTSTRIVIRTNYTGRTTRKIELSIDSFASGEKVGDTGLTAVEVIPKCFHEPLALVPEETTAKRRRRWRRSSRPLQ